MKLIITWDDFSKQFEKLIDEGNLLVSTTVNNESELAELRNKLKEYNEKVFAFLNSSFDEVNNEYAIGYRNEKAQRFKISNVGNLPKHLNQSKKELFEEIKIKINLLLYYKRLLSISDSIINPELVNLQQRDKFSTQQILDLILDKLYELYDNNYHSVLHILSSNGVIIKRYGEEREYLKKLEDFGYVNVTHTRETLGQLTLEGKSYVEEKRKVYTETYEDVSSDNEQISTIIDELKEQLQKVGIGQEILFEELQELKELHSKLNKKNWGQIVKGKLVDLALSKLIENDTLSYIYEKLTSHHLRLP
ncbi:MAG: hypothetical protein Q7U77_13495 [Sediminibacterium sp.]|uniref:hypothetical protein n=1 Tax=Sediminibacterium sp. TaxID=1917865 RepID=UPI0027262342|nr:hypothetical protein [Sediminibacterium sp.]MDO8997633.1 hypothetical protein [Sediminibacterium sp.]